LYINGNYGVAYEYIPSDQYTDHSCIVYSQKERIAIIKYLISVLSFVLVRTGGKKAKRNTPSKASKIKRL